ncbi:MULTISPECIES: hypothetical protein [Streptomyces]|uniref:hypothetical protein n=1 Tax=Streptomyces TaxID=1883 RepID=UPI0004CCEF77|nr:MULTISPECIES: hypothetical protein [Streptomyces]KOT52708.1 hypothetical protein ADK43_30080 [Streptomyces rimosus subsp. rimosus]
MTAPAAEAAHPPAPAKPPAESPTDVLVFHSNLVPAVPAGHYRLRAEHTAQHTRLGDTPQELPRAQEHFEVQAPRFGLDSAVIHARYPAPGAKGTFDTTLPHISLERATLPWERGVPGQDEQVPWLALLLFAEKELPADPEAHGLVERMGITQFLTEAGRPATVEGQCSTIRVPRSVHDAIAPGAQEARWLAHVREGTVDTPGASPQPPGKDGYAVVVANRFPAPGGGRYAAHLVSLELTGTTAVGEVRLLSLAAWSFTSQTDQHRSFAAVAAGLVAENNRQPYSALRLPEIPDGTSTVEKTVAERLKTGRHALVLHTWSGERSFAFYRGPLSASRPRPLPRPDGKPLLDQGIPDAARLLVYDQSLAAFDTGYAAAFTLGRLLALGDADFTTAYVRLLRHYHPRRTLRTPRIKGPASLHTPQHDDADLERVRTWLTALRELRPVPFSYLVPDERLLPRESVRFAHVDADWLRALGDGALSVALSDAQALKARDAVNAKLAGLPPAKQLPRPAAALLVRSDLIACWPALTCTAADADQKTATVTRCDRGPDTALFLFDRVPATVTFAEPHQGWHFGVTAEGVKLRQTSGTDTGKPTGKTVSVTWRAGGRRVLDVTAQKTALEKAGSSPVAFALQFIASPQTLTFTKS